MDATEGKGTAANPTASTVPAEDRDYEKLMKAEAKERVAAAEARVEKAKAHLAGAEDALAAAKRAVKEN